MTVQNRIKLGVSAAALIAVSACGLVQPAALSPEAQAQTTEERRETIWDIFNNQDQDVNVSVNRYIWNASLEVLNFMPVESIDPFTGVIVKGYGTPPGGNRAYRATVYVKDPALAARSLIVTLQGRDGKPVSASTQRAIEDAILSRARQLRIEDGRL
ncbi:DUF3576 domain-containing protein [Thalassobius sp. Cn5-15]|jgi:hypothetical protein|nr:DUF3576 domain-containing protein [Thalassobius sp. Cn5-15]MCG7494080.1 DUF3576 domain-containing protein [Thalassobius sp. Cn5-15]